MDVRHKMLWGRIFLNANLSRYMGELTVGAWVNRPAFLAKCPWRKTYTVREKSRRFVIVITQRLDKII